MYFLGVISLGISALSGSLSDKDPLIETIHSKVIETIENSDTISGVKECLHELVEKGVLEVTATDKEVRPYFVALQGIIEHVLASELNKSIQSLTGVIHTPMPATPLCTEGSISEELVDPSIAKDPLRLFTVKSRATIVRDYLFQGGKLHIVYPKEGIHRRTEQQQQIYKKELEKYPLNLFDCPLDCKSIDPELIGAFYLFENLEGKVFGFAIKMTQANNPQEVGSFGLWLGEVNNNPIEQRIIRISEEILKSGAILYPVALKFQKSP